MNNIFYKRLIDGVKPLGRYFNKYIKNIDKRLDVLIDLIERAKKSDQIDLWRIFDEPELSMDMILELINDDKERLKLLSAYYAIQYISININYLDILHFDLASKEDRLLVYYRYLKGIGKTFEKLSRAYLQHLVEIIIPHQDMPKFVMFSVGTPWDQDDIDLGVVDNGTGNRDKFNKYFSRLISEMLKNATPLHLYLAESLDSRFYTAAIQEYSSYTDKITDNFVLITELLNSKLITGDELLFTEFKNKIVARYLYKSWGDEKYHESFIRGILGEINLLLFTHYESDKLHPKNDALRVIKALLSAYKSIFNIYTHDVDKLFEKIIKHLPQHESDLILLKKSLIFIEIFRYLYQIFFIQDEVIDLKLAPQIPDVIAVQMGYDKVGVLLPGQRLLVDYYRHVDNAKRSVRRLFVTIEEHLKKISVFTKIFNQGIKEENSRFAINFIKEAGYFKNVKYWNDVIERLSADDYFFLRKIVKGFTTLSDKTYKKNLKKYIKWGLSSTWLLFEFIVDLNNCGSQPATKLKNAVLQYIFSHEEKLFEFTHQLIKLFNQSPELFPPILVSMTRDQAIKLFNFLDNFTFFSPELEQKLYILKYNLKIYANISNFIRKFYKLVIFKRPEYLLKFTDNKFLHSISNGLIGIIPSVMSIQQKIDLLKEYYSIEYTRIALTFLKEQNIKSTNLLFTEFSDYFFTYIFRICKLNINRRINKTIETKHKLAFLMTGGRGREDAFDDDYDVIFISENLTDEESEFTSQIIRMINNEINKLGTILQFHFSDRFKTFATPLSDIIDYFKSDDENLFIDMCQILTSRFISGSNLFVKKIQRSLIDDIIFPRKLFLINQLKNELNSRRKFTSEMNELTGSINIKESPGGLRETELLIYMLKSHFELNIPVNIGFFDYISEIDEKNKNLYFKLKNTYVFFKKIRYLYRILVTIGDEIKLDELKFIAPFLLPSISHTMIQETIYNQLSLGKELIEIIINRLNF